MRPRIPARMRAVGAAVVAAAGLVATACASDGSLSPTEGLGSDTSFTTTTAVPPRPGVVVAAGDIAVCSLPHDEATAEVVEEVFEDHPDAVVAAVGDLAYDRGTPEEFRDCYGPSWGRFKARTRPAPGNHEYRVDRAPGYFGYWGPVAGEPGKGWYSYDVAAWHIVVLNSNCDVPSVGGCGPESEQGRWLAADLTANTGKCTLGYWHHPRWSSGAHGTDPDMEPVWRLAADGGMDVIVNGHDHHYERFAVRDGIRQFVVGTGGANNYPVATAEEGSEVRQSRAHGVLKLTLHVDRYEWEFLPVEGQDFTDSGTSPCTP